MRSARCAADAWLWRRTAARTAGAQRWARPWNPPALRSGPPRGRVNPVRCAPGRGRARSARRPRCSIGWAGALSLSIGLRPGDLPRSSGREGRFRPCVPAVPICPNAPFGAPCFKLPRGWGRGRGRLRREGRGTGGDTAAPPGAGGRRAGGALSPARRGCGVVLGAWRWRARRRAGKVRSAQSIPAGELAGRFYVTCLVPRTGAASPGRWQGLQPGSLGRRREHPREVAPGPAPAASLAPACAPLAPLTGTGARGGRGAGSLTAHLAPAGLRAASGGVCEGGFAARGGGEAGESDGGSPGVGQFLAGVSQLLPWGLAFLAFPSHLALLLPLPLSPLPSNPRQVHGFCNAVGVVT